MDPLVKNLYQQVVNFSEIKTSVQPVNSDLNTTFELCFEKSDNLKIKTNKLLEIESVLDFLHDELNTGHWSDVPVSIRRAFTASSFIKSVMILENANEINNDELQQCLKTLDMGLLLGAPLELNMDLLTNCATILSSHLESKLQFETESAQNAKRKLDDVGSTQFNSLEGKNVESLICPSIETFNKYFSSKIPVKLEECVNHWPALNKWTDLNYLLKVCGERTVPVEIGSHYADENWSQKLMTLKNFISNYFLEATGTVGYLAQHNLFNQIPELRHDIHIPEYCCLSDLDDSEDTEPDINAWFGPSGTVSPLHHDPKNNILVQVFGTKQLVLFSPNDSNYLYPHEGTLMSNTAQVDPFQPDLENFPEFSKATAYKCILGAGDMLYIPPKWWHHVTSVEKSFSVSFWWN